MTFAQYSAVFEAVRKNTISEVEAILQLQIGHEGQLRTIEALRDLPPKFSGVKLSELDVEGSSTFSPYRYADAPAKENEVSMDDENRRVWLILKARNTKGVLIGMRAEGTNNAGTWGLPGGHPNIGEDAVAAVRRETLEETGMNISSLEITRLGDLEHKRVKHFFFGAEVDNVNEARLLGLLPASEEMDKFKFARVQTLRDVVKHGFAHKSIKRFLEFVGP